MGRPITAFRAKQGTAGRTRTTFAGRPSPERPQDDTRGIEALMARSHAMPIRRIAFDIDLTPADEAMLGPLLGNPVNLATALSGHGRAALGEYLETYLGRRAYTRGTDIQELRLALLVEHAFGGRIPDDTTISALLKTTPSGSRTLIRNTLAKYRHQLDAAMTASAKAVLEGVVWAGDDARSTQASTNVVELLNQRLLALDPTLKPVSRLAGSAGTWVIDEVSYDDLCPAFGATPVVKP